MEAVMEGMRKMMENQTSLAETHQTVDDMLNKKAKEEQWFSSKVNSSNNINFSEEEIMGVTVNEEFTKNLEKLKSLDNKESFINSVVNYVTTFDISNQ